MRWNEDGEEHIDSKGNETIILHLLAELVPDLIYEVLLEIAITIWIVLIIFLAVNSMQFTVLKVNHDLMLAFVVICYERFEFVWFAFDEII